MKGLDDSQYEELGRSIAGEFRDVYFGIADEIESLRLTYFQSVHLYNEGSITWDDVDSTAIECAGEMDMINNDLINNNEDRPLTEIIKETTAFQATRIDLDDRSAEFCAGLLHISSYDVENYPGREDMRDLMDARQWFADRPEFDNKVSGKLEHVVITGLQTKDFLFPKVVTATQECVASMWEARSKNAAGVATQ